MILFITIYVALGIILNLWTWDAADDKIFRSHSAIQGAYIVSSFVFWPIFFAMRTGRFLRKRFTDDVSSDKL